MEVGHAERRSLFGEDTAVVARKMSTVLEAGLTPLLCIGEHRKVAPNDAALFCAEQVRSALGDHVNGDPERLSSVLLAYEPLWAIGALAPTDPAYVDRVVAVLHKAPTRALWHRYRHHLWGERRPGAASPSWLRGWPVLG